MTMRLLLYQKIAVAAGTHADVIIHAAVTILHGQQAEAGAQVLHGHHRDAAAEDAAAGVMIRS